jgi:hypothetical protein
MKKGFFLQEVIDMAQNQGAAIKDISILFLVTEKADDGKLGSRRIKPAGIFAPTCRG